MARGNRPQPSETLPGHVWNRRQYTDHHGYLVVLEELVCPGQPANPEDRLAIPVYGTVPLDSDHGPLRDFILGEWFNLDPPPLLEIYSYSPPNAFACIDYHRRETAYRKHLHADNILNDETSPPLIPRVYHTAYHCPIGFCLLLNSHSYRVGLAQVDEDDEEVDTWGLGPDMLSFNRTFPHHLNQIDWEARISETYTSLIQDGEPTEIYPEALEMDVLRIRRQQMLSFQIIQNVYNNRFGYGRNRATSLDYALDIDEGQPRMELESADAIWQVLNQQLTEANVSLGTSYQISIDDGVVSVTNTIREPDLQYLIYVPFLSHIQDSQQLLKRTACLFTAAMATHLPQGKTLHLEFHIPPSAAWSSILTTQKAALRRHDHPLSIGALHTIPDFPDFPGPYRVSPQRRTDQAFIAKSMLRQPYCTFAVVLDKPAFVREAGVCFFMSDFDDRSLSRNALFPSTQVWRSAGMPEVARRLAMSAVDENQRGVQETRRVLEV